MGKDIELSHKYPQLKRTGVDVKIQRKNRICGRIKLWREVIISRILCVDKY